MRVKIKYALVLFLLSYILLFAQDIWGMTPAQQDRGMFIEKTLDGMVQQSPFSQAARDTVISEELDWWENMYATLGLQVGYIKGDTTYHISFDNDWDVGGHGESELEWPLGNRLIGVYASIAYPKDKKEERARLEFSWFTNLNKDVGKKMEDSDWIENDIGYINNNFPGYPVWDNPGKDLLGLLDTYLDKAHIFEVDYLYNFFVSKMISIGFLGGWKYQDFKFYGKNLDQKGYGPYEQIINDYMATVSDETIRSKWILYGATHSMPYLGIGAKLSLAEKFNLDLQFGFSDWVRIKDTDDHLYPDWDAANPGHNYDMVSPGRCKGEAYLGKIRGIWRFLPNWSFSVGANYVNIDTKGTSTEQFYLDGVFLGETEPIDDKVTAEYWLVSGAINYAF